MPDIAHQLEKMNQNLTTLTDLLRQSIEIDKDIRDKIKPESGKVW